MNLKQEYFSTTSRGEQVDAYTLDNGQGISVKLITYGARIVSCITPDRHGKRDEITRSSPELSDFETVMPYHGAAIGRFTNRIAGASVRIDGIDYTLNSDNPKCQLHGGPGGLHQVVWSASPLIQEDRVSVVFTHRSPDGDQGFPGELDIAHTITLTSTGELSFLYLAETTHPTCVSLTNHTFWNLAGSGTVFDHVLQIHAQSVVEADEHLIPTGLLVPVAETRYDFTSPKPVGRDIASVSGKHGYDICYVVQDARSCRPVSAAIAEDPSSGRRMEVLTDAPGMQFYTDNFSDPPHRAFCLEAGELPDAMHHASFPQPIVRPGEPYRQLTVHRFFS